MIGVIGEGNSLKIHRDRLSLIYYYAPYLMTYLKNNCVWRFYFLKKVNVQIHTFFIWVKRTCRFVDGSVKPISQTLKLASRSTRRAHNCPPVERGPQFGHLWYRAIYPFLIYSLLIKSTLPCLYTLSLFFECPQDAQASQEEEENRK